MSSYSFGSVSVGILWDLGWQLVLPDRTCVCFSHHRYYQLGSILNWTVQLVSFWTMKTLWPCDGQTLTMHPLGVKCIASPARAKAERDNFPCCLSLPGRFSPLSFILPLKICPFLGPNLIFQFGSHLAWTSVDAPPASSNIIVYLPPEMIFKIFINIIHMLTNQNKCRLYLHITSEYQPFLTF